MLPRSLLLRSLSERCDVDQGAGIRVFQHPQRSVGSLFHIADATADVPALGDFRATMAVEEDASETLAHHAADETAAIPLGEGLRARIEHQIAGRDHRDPIERRFGEIGSRVVRSDRHAVVVHPVRHQRPPVVLALLDQVQLVAAARAVLDLPEFTGR